MKYAYVCMYLHVYASLFLKVGKWRKYRSQILIANQSELQSLNLNISHTTLNSPIEYILIVLFLQNPQPNKVH